MRAAVVDEVRKTPVQLMQIVEDLRQLAADIVICVGIRRRVRVKEAQDIVVRVQIILKIILHPFAVHIKVKVRNAVLVYIPQALCAELCDVRIGAGILCEQRVMAAVVCIQLLHAVTAHLDHFSIALHEIGVFRRIRIGVLDKALGREEIDRIIPCRVDLIVFPVNFDHIPFVTGTVDPVGLNVRCREQHGVCLRIA